MPFWSSASWVSAVMLIGTLLMLSSRRVAVTTISSSAAPAGAGALVAAGAVSVGFASLAAATTAPSRHAHIRVPKNNNEGRAGLVIAFERVAGIISPRIVIWSDNSTHSDSSTAINRFAISALAPRSRRRSLAAHLHLLR